MSQIWNLFLYHPLINALIFLYQFLFHNLGWAIIILTMVIRAILIPLTMPSLKAAKKMKELAPEIGKLKKKHQNDSLLVVFHTIPCRTLRSDNQKKPG